MINHCVRHERIKLDSKKAAEFLGLNDYDGQRHFKESRLSELRAKIIDNRFGTAHIDIAVCVWKDDEMLLVNGQHTCQTILRFKEQPVTADELEGIESRLKEGQTEVVLPNAVVEYHQVHNLDDLFVLYGQFDSAGQIRSQTEVNHASACRWRDGKVWQDRTKNLMVQGVIFLKTYGHRSVASRDQRARMLREEHMKPGLLVDELLHGKQSTGHWRRLRLPRDRRHLTKIPVVAAIIKTFDVDPTDAYGFWASIANGTGLIDNTAELALCNYLKSLKPGVMSVRDQRLCYSRCINAWNAYREGRPVTSLGTVRPTQPIPVAV